MVRRQKIMVVGAEFTVCSIACSAVFSYGVTTLTTRTWQTRGAHYSKRLECHNWSNWNSEYRFHDDGRARGATVGTLVLSPTGSLDRRFFVYRCSHPSELRSLNLALCAHPRFAWWRRNMYVLCCHYLAVSTWFDKGRGFAIGIVIAGTGLGSMIWRPATRSLTQHLGYKNVLRISGCVWGCLVGIAGCLLR